jgi:hypothetical protein
MQSPMQAAEAPPGRGEGIRISHLWAIAAIVLPAGLATLQPMVAIDLAYVVRAGELMLAQGSVLRTGAMASWGLGSPWLNQQWGAELLFAAVFRAGGWLGLAALRGLSVGLILGLIYLACRAAGAGRRPAAILTFCASLVVAAGLNLRAQLLGMVCFAGLLWLLQGRRQHPRRLWWAVPIVVVWANAHGSFFLGPLLLSLAAVDDRIRKTPGANGTALVALASLPATLLSPFGPRVWSYVVEVSSNPLVQQVSEWQPPSLRTYTGLMFFLSAIAVSVFLARRPGRVPWNAIVPLVLLFAIGLPATRGTLWWGIGAPVIVAGLLPAPRRVAPDPANRANTAIAAILVVMALVPLAAWAPHSGQGPPPGRLVKFAPPGVTAQLQELLAPGERFFHPQEWGSWFELALPNNPALVDSRFELMPEGVWSDYEAVSSARADWKEILDRWDIRVAVLAPDQQEELIPVMRADPDWKLVYEDADGLIFTRI